ncbi:unnamed protein product, partial [Adineta ricciae]
KDDSLDLVVANQDNSSISVLLGTRNGTFRLEKTIVVDIGPSFIVLHDLNNDFKLYVIVTNQYSNTFNVILNNDYIYFTSGEEILVGRKSSSVISTDLNNDKIVDFGGDQWTK